CGVANPRHGRSGRVGPQRPPVVRRHRERRASGERRLEESRNDERPASPEVRSRIGGIEVAKSPVGGGGWLAGERGARALARRRDEGDERQKAGEPGPHAASIRERRPRPPDLTGAVGRGIGFLMGRSGLGRAWSVAVLALAMLAAAGVLLAGPG